MLAEYIGYYNLTRPHQGRGQDVPKGYTPQSRGEVLKMPILSGLHHRYYRRAA
jgi:hypothetical protein